LLVGGVRCLAEFAMGLVLVGVGDELGEHLVGAGEFDDVFRSPQGDETFLPVVVTAFDFCLWRGAWGRRAV